MGSNGLRLEVREQLFKMSINMHQALRFLALSCWKGWVHHSHQEFIKPHRHLTHLGIEVQWTRYYCLAWKRRKRV